MAEHVIKLPDVGEGVAEAELVEWQVKVGDMVREDAILGAVMTDKATVEIPSPVEGEIVWLGAIGGVVTTPIINHPEVAIVGVNKIVVRPVWDGTAFQPRKMMNLSSSFDHRIIDGFDAASFVQRIRALLETPALIFMEG